MQELAGEWKRRVLDAIAHEAYRHSSEAEIARRANLHPRFLSQARKRGRIQLDQALALIAALGRDPADFIAIALGRKGALGRTEALEPQVPSPPPLPEFVARAYDRAQSRSPSTIPRPHLEQLASQREARPQATMAAIEASLDFIHPQDVPFALGIWATVRRQALDYDGANRALTVGLELAQDNPRAQVRLLLKRAALVGIGKNDNPGAEAIFAEVAERCRQSGDLDLLASSRIDRATFARTRGDFDQALDYSLRAAEDVSAEDTRGLSSAFQVAALCHLECGNRHRAASYLDRMEQLRPQTPPYLWVFQDWLQALALAPSESAKAERTLHRVVRTLSPIDPQQAALAAIDLGCLMLQWGEAMRALRTLQELLPYCLTRAPNEAAQLRVRLFLDIPDRPEREHLDAIPGRIPGVLAGLRRPDPRVESPTVASVG